MTNTEQTVANQISGSDQSQEEVHLTELVPVEQSRIIETIDDKDINATDALKALRSFARCNDNNFTSQFNFCDKIVQLQNANSKFEDLKEGNDGNPLQKRRASRWKHLTEHFDRICADEFSNKTELSVIPTKTKRRKDYKNNCSLDKEIYVYHQQQELRKKKPRFILPKISQESDSNHEKGSSSDESSSSSQSQKTNLTDDTRVRDVPQKIDAIIQENYLLLEQQKHKYRLSHENNNVMPQSSNKFRYRLIPPPNDSKKIGQLSEQGDNKIDEHQFKKYGCMLCSAKFKGTGGLRNHYKVMHGTGPLYKCDECGKEFPLKERLKLHVRTHTGFRPYKCNECDKTFARGGQLVQHRRTHSQVKPYRCNLCSGMFTCAANLSLHMKRHTGQKDHKCDICGRGFVRRDALKKHLECLHQDVKSFLCVICNKTFKGHLPQHMRTHAQDRPHGCATCGQRFAQKSQLTVHQRTHSGQRPFRCLVCWQAFAHSTALKLHTRRHTGERPFKCTECNAGFTQLPHWKKHMKCIHGRNEPYCCKNCKSFFRIKSELETHEKTCSESSPKDQVIDVSTIKVPNKYCGMSIEKMRLLLAVLLKRISKPEKLEELGFGKRLIDEILEDSLISAGKVPVHNKDLDEYETLRKNLETFLEWTVPREHWKNFRKKKKTPEQILETLTAT